jgi:hypothetical protein
MRVLARDKPLLLAVSEGCAPRNQLVWENEIVPRFRSVAKPAADEDAKPESIASTPRKPSAVAPAPALECAKKVKPADSIFVASTKLLWLAHSYPPTGETVCPH